MTPELVVIWSGGELLPDRPERTMLPVMRDYWADLADLRESREHRPANTDGRICACGCGAVLPKRARRRGKLPTFAHGHHGRGKVSPLKGRVRT